MWVFVKTRRVVPGEAVFLLFFFAVRQGPFTIKCIEACERVSCQGGRCWHMVGISIRLNKLE